MTGATISRDSLKAAFTLVDRVGANPGLLASQYVKLIYEPKPGVLRLLVTGLTMAEATVKVNLGTQAWKFFVDRRVLGVFLNSAATDILASLKETTLTLKSGRRRIEVTSASEISGYSRWKPSDTAKKFKLSDDSLVSDLTFLSKYAPMTAAADHLSVVCLAKGLGVVATDTFTFAARIDPGMAVSFPLPADLASTLEAIYRSGGLNHLLIEPNGVGAQCNGGYLYQTASTASKKYPLDHLKRLIKKGQEFETAIAFQAKPLNEALEYLHGFVFGSDVDTVVRGKAAKKGMTLTTDLPHLHGTVDKWVPSTGQLDFVWSLPTVSAWVNRMVALGAEAVVYFRMADDFIYGFRAVAKEGAPMYLLMLADHGGEPAGNA